MAAPLRPRHCIQLHHCRFAHTLCKFLEADVKPFAFLRQREPSLSLQVHIHHRKSSGSYKEGVASSCLILPQRKSGKAALKPEEAPKSQSRSLVQSRSSWTRKCIPRKHACIYTYTHRDNMYMYIYIYNVYIHTNIHSCTCICTHVYLCTYTQVRMYVCMHASMHACM